MPAPASATSIGGRRSAASQRTGPSSTQRKSAGSSSRTKVTSWTGNSGIWKFYSENSPGVKVGPVPILAMSLTFIASVFMLHL